MPDEQDAIPERQIRAVYDDTTIRVYQAYSDQIAESAGAWHQPFVIATIVAN